MENDRCEEKVNSPAGSRTIAPWLVRCGFFVLPFLVLFWICPFLSPWTIGNDYTRYPIQHQLELMFSLRQGTFPLFIPGFAGGHTAGALTLGQIFHPISHLASLLPGYWSGAALQWNTFLRLLSLGLAHWALYKFNRSIRLGMTPAFVLSFITVYNLRMLDLFRYGASLESWTGLILLCATIGFFYNRPHQRLLPFAVIGSTYWLICSGHPQMAYYGLIGAGLFTGVLPFFIQTIHPERPFARAPLYKFYLSAALFIAVGVFLSSAYTFPFRYDFLAENAGRVHQSYTWADSYRDSFSGTLNNFFLPLRSDVHGAFGGSALILLAGLIPLSRIFGFKIPNAIWLIWLLVLLSFLYMQGGRTPLHYLAWQYLPFGSSMRIAGRISMLLPLLIMLLLVWLMKAPPARLPLGKKPVFLDATPPLAAIALIMLIAWYFIPESILGEPATFSPMRIRRIPERIEWLSMILAAAVLFSAAVNSFIQSHRVRVRRLFAGLVCIQVVLILSFGTWVEKSSPTPGYEQMLAQKQRELTYRNETGNELITKRIKKHIERDFLEPDLAKVYIQAIAADNNGQAYRKMHQLRHPDLVVLEGCQVQDLIQKHRGAMAGLDARIDLIYSNYNKLRFSVQTSQEAYLALSYPFSKHWQAYVNGQQAPVYRANGAYMATVIPAGRGKVEFQYFSAAAMWGMIVSCSTMILIGIVSIRRYVSNPRNLIALGAAVTLGVGLYYLWYNAAVNGPNIGTHYRWEYNSVKGPINLAYGKPTTMSSRLHPQAPFLFANGQAVDGKKDPGKGFITGFQSNPWWMLDLSKPVSITQIRIYEGKWGTANRFNKRPLSILGSLDGRSWSKLSDIEASSEPGMLELNYNDPPRVKFILIKADGRCHLAFDEIEVYSVSDTAAEALKVTGLPEL